MNKMMISILGTAYELIIDNEIADSDVYGVCDRYAKTIRINKNAFVGEGLTKNIQDVVKKTVRHELLHGIFHEMGLDCYAEDEVLIDALAIIYPKIENIMKQAEKNINVMIKKERIK